MTSTNHSSWMSQQWGLRQHFPHSARLGSTRTGRTRLVRVAPFEPSPRCPRLLCHRPRRRRTPAHWPAAGTEVDTAYVIADSVDMHGAKTLSWYSQLPRDATESSQLALNDVRSFLPLPAPHCDSHVCSQIFYSRTECSPPRRTAAGSMSSSVKKTDAGVGSTLKPTFARMSSRESLVRERSFEIEVRRQPFFGFDML